MPDVRSATEAPSSRSEPVTELVFEQAVDGLFHRGLKQQLTPPIRDRLMAAGLDLSRPLQPAYPRAKWNEFVRIAAESLWPGDPPEKAYRALGRQLLSGYSETLLGRALASMIRVIGPRRALERMTHNFRSGSNYNECKVTVVGPTEVLFWMNEAELHPAYVAGILDGALVLTGARDATVEVERRDSAGCTYRIKWVA